MLSGGNYSFLNCKMKTLMKELKTNLKWIKRRLKEEDYEKGNEQVGIV